MRENLVATMKDRGMPEPKNVFLNQDGRPMSWDSVEDAVAHAAERAGFVGKALEEGHPHTLRHSCGNHLLHEYGWDIASVSYFLGDTIATVEKYYAHTGINDCKRNMMRMG